jgi:hypothetical protein
LKRDGRLDGQRTGDRNPLLHAPGELSRVVPAEAVQPDQIQVLAGAPGREVASQAQRSEAGRDVLGGRLPRQQARLLEDDADGWPVRTGVHGAAVDEHRPLVWRLKAGQDAEQGRLAAPVRPEKAEELARSDAERQSIQDRDLERLASPRVSRLERGRSCVDGIDQPRFTWCRA